MDKYECLKLKNQLCFPLYSASNAITRRYKPLLKELDLTYTQYIVMMVLWEYGTISARDLGKKLYLDSGTLTPLLKKMEKDGFVTRRRSDEDERVTLVRITDKGMALRDPAAEIPFQVGGCLKLPAEDAQNLYQIMYKLLGEFS